MVIFSLIYCPYLFTIYITALYTFVNSANIFGEANVGPVDVDIVAEELSRLFPLLQQKLIKPFEHLARSRVSALQFQVLYLLEEAAFFPCPGFPSSCRYPNSR